MDRSAPLRSFAPALLVGLALGGCLVGKSEIGEVLDDDGGSSGSSGSSGGPVVVSSVTASETGNDNGDGDGDNLPDPSAGDSSTADSGGEPVGMCPAWSQCSQPLACPPEGFEECGGVVGRSDDDGCPRQRCSGPGECPAGTSCFLPWSWGLCGHHECEDDENGACECGFGLDCNNNGLCVPMEEDLPPDTNATDFCGQHDDATSCEVALSTGELGVCRWYEGWQVPQEGVCEERVEVGRCVFSSAFVSEPSVPSCPGNEALTPMAYVDDGVITVLFVDPAETPNALEMDFDVDSYGWLTCDQPEVEDACACACA